MKTKIIKSVSVLLLSLGYISSSFAVGAGGYAGLNVGMGNTQVKRSGALDSSDDKTSTSTGAAGGFTVGYQFNNYGAAELGYTHWTNGSSPNEPSCGSAVIHNDSLNLMGKGIVPFGESGFDVFAKAGFAGVRSSGGGSCSGRNFTNSAKPIAAVGASYDLSQTWVTDVSYTRLFVNNSQVSNTSLLALSITYHWADVYCGQFLC
jgi:hypothetical protein